MISSAVVWLGFFERCTKFSVLDHPNPSAKSSPYGSIFYAFHLAGALVNCGLRTMFIFKCLTLSRFVGHSVYCCCCNCVFVCCCCCFFYNRQREKIYGFHILAHRKIGEGKGRDAWVCFENFLTSVKAKSRTWAIAIAYSPSVYLFSFIFCFC